VKGLCESAADAGAAASDEDSVAGGLHVSFSSYDRRVSLLELGRSLGEAFSGVRLWVEWRGRLSLQA
jgi:hypothetical protein